MENQQRRGCERPSSSWTTLSPHPAGKEQELDGPDDATEDATDMRQKLGPGHRIPLVHNADRVHGVSVGRMYAAWGGAPW